MIEFFRTIVYIPLFNALVFLYTHLPWEDLGAVIVLLTILIRIVLLPIFYKTARDQAILQRIAPLVKKIQAEHKGNIEKQGKALMDLYREHRVHPFSGFFLLLVQLPVIISLYSLFLHGLTEDAFSDLYSFVVPPDHFNHIAFGGLVLTERSLFLAALASVAQYVQGIITLLPQKKNPEPLTQAEQIGRNMTYMAPFITFIFLYFFDLPAAVALYWLTSSIFSAIQQLAINKTLPS